MTEEGSIVQLVSSFLKIFNRNKALLIKLSQNHLYKILGIGCKKGKKKPMGWEKKKSKKRYKKKPEAASISEVQPINQYVSSYLSSQSRRSRGRSPRHRKMRLQTCNLR